MEEGGGGGGCCFCFCRQVSCSDTTGVSWCELLGVAPTPKLGLWTPKSTSNYLAYFQKNIKTDSNFPEFLYYMRGILPELNINSPCSFPLEV